jgi:hypothetical protein
MSLLRLMNQNFVSGPTFSVDATTDRFDSSDTQPKSCQSQSRRSHAPAFCELYHRCIVARDGLIEAVTQGKHESKSVDRTWIPDPISINTGYYQGCELLPWI